MSSTTSSPTGDLLVVGADLAGAGRGDLLIRDGVFVDPAEARPDARRVDADGLVALPGLVDLAATVRATGSPVLGLGGDERFRAACDLAVAGPDLPELLAPLALPIPAQLLTERLARRLGLDPDAPRGLRKVTQTD